MPQRSTSRPRLEVDVEQVQKVWNQRFTLQEAAEQLKVLLKGQQCLVTLHKVALICCKLKMR